MPDFLRWIIAGVTSVVVAGLVFLLATVGIVVAFFVFLVLFVVFGPVSYTHLDVYKRQRGKLFG